MTFRTMRWLAVVALVLNVAFAFVALLWLTTRVGEFRSARVLWPWWQDFDIVASASWGAASAFTVLALWIALRKTRRGPEVDALRARDEEEVRLLEAEIQRAELQKRLRDLTRTP